MSRSPASLSEAVLEQSPGCRWMVDSEFVFQRIYGDPSAVFGKLSQELIGQVAGEAWPERFARVFTGESVELHERCGATLWSISVFPIRIDGAIQFAAGTARPLIAGDNTEQYVRAAVASCVQSREAERGTITRFLHDSIGQNLTALGLQLDLVRMDLEAMPEVAGKRIAEIQQTLQGMMEEVREYIYAVRP